MGVLGCRPSRRLPRFGPGGRPGSPVRARPGRRCGDGPRRDERGGAISLWVVLMVPVSAFAAVVAMAGPQRVAAESTMQDAADDLAMLAVAWRDGQGANPGDMHAGPLYAFSPECSTEGQGTRFDAEIEASQGLVVDYQDRIDDFPRAGETLTEQQLEDALRAEQGELGDSQARRVELLEDWRRACDLLFESLLRDLGYLGVDMNSLRGFYSDSLKMSDETTVKPPCRASAGAMVEDAVHVALAADWSHAGWAAAQVWPDGTRMAAESVGRLSRRDATTVPARDCNDILIVLDERGRPVLDPTANSRVLTRSVPRTSLSG